MIIEGADILAELGLDPDDVEVRDGSEDADNLARLVQTLVAARKAAGQSQQHVAQVMGTSQSAVSDIERTAGDPRISTLQRYARAAGLRLCLVATTPRTEYVASSSFRVSRPKAERSVVHWQESPRRLAAL